MADALTPRQADVLAFIRAEIARTGLPPTRAEIARALQFRSPNAAETHLQALARKGALVLMPGAARGIQLSDPEAATGLPLIGRVAAGAPLLAVEHIEAHYRLDPALFHPPADYLLRVSGMSMRDAGILDGDLLAVQRAREARNGQIVVARIEDEVTVKRWRRQGERLQLLAENPDFAPIEIDLRTQSVALEGVAVGVIRGGLA